MTVHARRTLKILVDRIQIREDTGDAPAELREIPLEGKPRLSEAIWNLAEDALEEGIAPLFGHVCGRCGNCCGHFSIFVQASEIYALRRHLGMKSDEEFRDRYLEPSPTWNPFDGFLRRERGGCPFLTREAPSRPAACAVYPVRPDACRRHLPVMDMCRKEPGKLFSHLWDITIRDGRLAFTAGLGNTVTIERPSPALAQRVDALYRELEELPESSESRLDGLLRAARRLVERCLGMCGAPTEALNESLGEIEEILARLSSLARPGGKERSQVEELWGAFRILQRKALARPGVEAPAECSAAEDCGEWILTVYPQCLTVDSGPYRGASIPYDESPALLGAARGILRELALDGTDTMHDALTEPDPPCYLCGDCCRFYCVEVTPYDVERLAESLAMAEDELRVKLTDPPRFSWNKGNAVLKKQTGGEHPPCVFLERREDDLYYCGVHAFKPDVCRNYSAKSRFCRKVSNPAYWHRQAAGVLGVTVTREGLAVRTVNTVLSGAGSVAMRDLISPVLSTLLETVRREASRAVTARLSRPRSR